MVVFSIKNINFFTYFNYFLFNEMITQASTYKIEHQLNI